MHMEHVCIRVKCTCTHRKIIFIVQSKSFKNLLWFRFICTSSILHTFTAANKYSRIYVNIEIWIQTLQLHMPCDTVNYLCFTYVQKMCPSTSTLFTWILCLIKNIDIRTNARAHLHRVKWCVSGTVLVISILAKSMKHSKYIARQHRIDRFAHNSYSIVYMQNWNAFIVLWNE